MSTYQPINLSKGIFKIATKETYYIIYYMCVCVFPAYL